MFKAWASWRDRVNMAMVVALISLGLSLLNYLESHFYSQRLDVSVTEISYTRNGSLYLTAAFANDGNRDAVLLRLEAALWTQRERRFPTWTPVMTQVDPDIPLIEPKVPLVIRPGDVEVVTITTRLRQDDINRELVASSRGAFVGVRIATMESSGNLHLIEHPVLRFLVGNDGTIHGAEPAIHRRLSGFVDMMVSPPGDLLKPNKSTPFVWADTDR